MGFLLKRADYNHSPSRSCYVKHTNNTVAVCKPNLPQLAFEMFDMRSPQVLQPAKANKVRYACKLGTNFCREREKLISDRIVEQLDSPFHSARISHL